MKLPFIGWKGCEERFYLDALPITHAEAVKHWKLGTATFGENAHKRIRTLLLGNNLDWHIESTQGPKYND